MKKILTLILFPIIIQATEIDKIIYNGREDSLEVSLNSDIRSGEKLDISKIDDLVSNFKYVKSNDIDIKIEPSDIEGKLNIVISVENDEVGKYRYNISTGLEGLILNEKLDISYTFVRPINLERKKIIK